MACSGPLTQTPIGSPCGCVFPMKVVIDVGVISYVLLQLVQELEVEVAAGTFLKQSQVKIISVLTSPRDQGKAEVTLYLVPLGERFDKMTALLIYERFWQKKVPVNKSLFHEYEVINVHYPGLPSPPPSSFGRSASGPSEPGSYQYPFTANVPTDKTQKMNNRIIAVVALSSLILLLLCLGFVIFVLKAVKLGKPATTLGPASSSIARRPGIRSLLPSSLASSRSASFLSTMATCPQSLRTFSLSELEKATDEFDIKRKLGEGGSGCVYHGIMEDGSDVAVKLLKRVNQDRDREGEFISEVEMLSRLHHRNLVKLIGICIEGRKRCLVYELVRNGSVESHLHGADKGKGPLDWDARMKIALGAARALAYLHEDSNPRVIHRDFKASNVLLEEDYTPKVSDFGLAREASEGSNHVSTRVMGTFGYVAPEYAMTGHLLIKSDVYSYGVVLLELLSGQKPVMSNLEGPENLVVWARPLLGTKEGLDQLLDPYLKENYDFENLSKVAAVASMCVHSEPSQRPFMGEVVQALKLICSNKEEIGCEDSNSQKDSSFGQDFGPESSWGGASPSLVYGSFLNMEYSSDSMEEIKRAHSVDSLVRFTQSGPLRAKRKKKRELCKLRGSVSEHGHPYG
ncbi:receptor-like serine/threonine-protein kinase ALE2 isoform X2 [Asparagus officinalis]|nr:receptor-like serine/threonine-protein kinase ALE2 isoform X2 [Asparagus officinalis]